WHFEQLHGRRSFEITVLTRLHLRVAALTQQHRQPTDFEIRSRANDEIRAAHLRDQARPRLDVVDVLIGRRRGNDVDLVAADFLRQRLPLRLARKNVESRVSGSGEKRKYRNQRKFVHGGALELMRAVRAEAEGALQDYLVIRFGARAI